MNKKTPKLRFKKFTDAWKQLKLSSYLDVSSEKNVDNFFSKDDVLSVSGDYGVVNQIEFQGRSFAGTSVSNYGVVHTGNVIYTKSPLKANPYGIIKTNKGESGIVSTLYAVYSVKENSFPNFIQDYFELNSRLNNYLRPLVNKGSKNDMKVSNENALKGLVIFPGLEEQRKISTFLAQLNNTITLQQRKIGKLISLKKAYLYQMFPQKGSHLPEIRFSEFTDDWKQLKLGSIVEKVTQKNSNLEINETFTNSAEQGIISQNDFFDHKVSSSDNIGKYYVVGKGDFVYNPRISSTAPVGPINRNRLERAGVVSPLYTVFRVKDVDPLFLEWYFKSSCWHLYMFINGDCGARADRFAIKDPVFFSMPILVPSKEEQFKIGMFFEKLNGNISIQKRKLEKLKQLKSSYLNSMFI